MAAVAAAILTCQNMQAQFKYGIHAGLNLETQAELGQLWNNADLYQGFLVGGFLEYSTGNIVSLQTELNYQKKGSKIKSTFDGSESIERREFNYLTVPLLVKGKFHDATLGENYEFSFFSGPYLGFLTSANEKEKSGNITVPVDIDNLAKKNDCGIIIGAGITYKLAGGGAIVGELRYQMGLTRVDRTDPDLRNKGMGLTLGYRF